MDLIHQTNPSQKNAPAKKRSPRATTKHEPPLQLESETHAPVKSPVSGSKRPIAIDNTATGAYDPRTMSNETYLQNALITHQTNQSRGAKKVKQYLRRYRLETGRRVGVDRNTDVGEYDRSVFNNELIRPGQGKTSDESTEVGQDDLQKAINDVTQIEAERTKRFGLPSVSDLYSGGFGKP